MKLLQADQWAVSAALADVHAAAADLAAVHDTESAKQALLTVRSASVKAYGLVDDAARRAYEAAKAQLETAA